MTRGTISSGKIAGSVVGVTKAEPHDFLNVILAPFAAFRFCTQNWRAGAELDKAYWAMPPAARALFERGQRMLMGDTYKALPEYLKDIAHLPLVGRVMATLERGEAYDRLGWGARALGAIRGAFNFTGIPDLLKWPGALASGPTPASRGQLIPIVYDALQTFLGGGAATLGNLPERPDDGQLVGPNRPASRRPPR